MVDILSTGIRNLGSRLCTNASMSRLYAWYLAIDINDTNPWHIYFWWRHTLTQYYSPHIINTWSTLTKCWVHVEFILLRRQVPWKRFSKSASQIRPIFLKLTSVGMVLQYEISLSCNRLWSEHDQYLSPGKSVLARSQLKSTSNGAITPTIVSSKMALSIVGFIYECHRSSHLGENLCFLTQIDYVCWIVGIGNIWSW